MDSIVDEDSTQEIETVTHEAPAPVQVTPPVTALVTVHTLFSHPDAHPIVLGIALIRRYGKDWLTWEPETVRYSTGIDLGPMSDLNFSKVMAVKTLQLVDSFWSSWEVFIACAMPFNDRFPDFDAMQVPTLPECLVAVDIANRVRNDMVFSGEMKAYLEVVYKHDGLFFPMPPIDFITVSRKDFEVSVDDVQARWPDVRRTKKPPTGTTPEDEQLRRMLRANEYLEDSRQRFHAQLPLVEQTL